MSAMWVKDEGRARVRWQSCAVAACLLVTGSASADLLLDYGVADLTSGFRTIGGLAYAVQFQPFTVPAPGWDLSSIGIFGARNPGLMVIGAVLDGGSTTVLDGIVFDLPEASPLTVPNFEWREVPVTVTLMPGDYTLMLTASSADDSLVGAYSFGATGPNGSSTNDLGTNGQLVGTLRIQGVVIPAPAGVSAFAGLLLAARRRRRRPGSAGRR